MSEVLAPTDGRHARQALVEGWDQAAIGRATAIVAGAGALGNEVVKLLAMMGIGELVIVDPDVVEASNLSRAVLFRPDDVGLPKAEVAARRARDLNPSVRVRAIVGDATSDVGLGDFARATMVFGCLDSVLARWLLNRRCLAAGVEWIDGGTAERHGQVGRYGPSGGACFECTMTARSFDRLSLRFRCGFRDSQASGPPMPATATLSSAIAAIQVQEALHVAMGVEDPAGLHPGQRLSVCLRPYWLAVDDLPPRADCEAHADAIPGAALTMARPWASTSVDDVIGAAREVDPTANRIDLGYELVTPERCEACGAGTDVSARRTHVTFESLDCPACNERRPFASTTSIWAGDVLASLPLGRLSIPPREWLAVRGDGPEPTIVEVGAGGDRSGLFPGDMRMQEVRP